MKTKPKRSYYVDWLRVLAVLALFPFHVGQIYNEAAFYVKDNAIKSLYLWGSATLFINGTCLCSCFLPGLEAITHFDSDQARNIYSKGLSGSLSH